MSQPEHYKYRYPIGRHVRAAQAVGMSLQDIADLCGVSRGTVAQWSNGKSSPKSRVAERTAGAAKASRDALAADPVRGSPHRAGLRRSRPGQTRRLLRHQTPQGTKPLYLESE